jgi:hypothetical protein
VRTPRSTPGVRSHARARRGTADVASVRRDAAGGGRARHGTAGVHSCAMARGVVSARDCAAGRVRARHGAAGVLSHSKGTPRRSRRCKRATRRRQRDEGTPRHGRRPQRHEYMPRQSRRSGWGESTPRRGRRSQRSESMPCRSARVLSGARACRCTPHSRRSWSLGVLRARRGAHWVAPGARHGMAFPVERGHASTQSRRSYGGAKSTPRHVASSIYIQTAHSVCNRARGMRPSERH